MSSPLPQSGPKLTDERAIDPTKERFFVASQAQLMWWKFLKHRMAVVGGIVVIFLYLVAIFGDFIAPYNPHYRTGHPFAPPQLPRFVDNSGNFHLRPFVYGVKSQMDMTTFKRVYVPDESKVYPLKFFVRGYEYKLFGLFKTDLHLFGTDEGGVIYLCGTDQLGRDVFSRMVYGTRVSLSIGLVGVLISLVLGIILGGVSGLFGGVIDLIIQRLIEVIQAFPSIPLWMTLAAALPADWSPLLVYFGITVILSFIGWTGLARVVRGWFLSLRNEDFVLAARLSGASESRIIFKHLLPSFLSHIIASVTLSIPGMILSETSLSFLGIGLRPPVISWGVLLQDAQNIHAVAMAPWLLYPALLVVLAVLAFNFVGDGLRDAADPYTTAT
ncbi:MAG: ABC transporter permease [Firmicutes bacterium]|nr:ABC transporter permease [Bacillota bacterium]